MRGDEVTILPDWPLVSAADASGHWWPSGWQVVASDDKLLYVLMQQGAHEGTHKNPATEVWVFDVATKERVKRLHLTRPGSAVAVTHGAEPLMLVQTAERLDVYGTGGGLVRSLDLPGFTTRMQIEPVR